MLEGKLKATEDSVLRVRNKNTDSGNLLRFLYFLAGKRADVSRLLSNMN